MIFRVRMIKFLLLAIVAGAIYFSGYKAGENHSAVFYEQQKLSEIELYKERLDKAEEKASQLSQEYLELTNELSVISTANDELVMRLHKYERASSARSDKNSGCAANRATRARLPSEVALHINELTKRADQAALYARQCYKWVIELQRDRARKEPLTQDAL